MEVLLQNGNRMEIEWKCCFRMEIPKYAIGPYRLPYVILSLPFVAITQVIGIDGGMRDRGSHVPFGLQGICA